MTAPHSRPGFRRNFRLRRSGVFVRGRGSGLMVIALLLLMFGITAVLFFPQGFSIVDVECRSSSGACPDDLSADAARLIGTPVVLVKPHSLSRRLLRLDPRLRSANASTSFWKRILFVDLTYRAPVIQLVEDVASAMSRFVDDEGILFEDREVVEDVPAIVWKGSAALGVGNPVPEPIRRAVVIGRHLETVVGVRPDMSVEDSLLTAEFANRFIVFFSLNRDPAAQLSALQALLRNRTIGEGVRTVDLRFEQPIVTH